MATKVFIREDSAGGTLHADTHLASLAPTAAGAQQGWQTNALSLVIRPSGGAASNNVNTVAGPTNGIELGTNLSWISPPLDRDVTIAGTVTVNLWGSTSAAANAGPQVIIERIDSQLGVASTILNSERGVAYPTPSNGLMNWTAAPTSTACKKGDRLRLRILGNDVGGNMLTGQTIIMAYGGPTPGANGDAWVQFAEDFGFQTTDPAGSQLFLTETAASGGINPGANIEKEAWTSRGGAAVNGDIATPSGSWIATPGTQFRDSTKTTPVEWYSRPLAPFTLSGFVLVQFWCVAAATTYGSVRAEVAICNSDGTGAVVWASAPLSPNRGTIADYNGNISTTAGLCYAVVAGPDIAISAQQRLRFRLYEEDNATRAATTVVSLYWNGPTAAAAGDTYATLPQNVAEATSAAYPTGSDTNAATTETASVAISPAVPHTYRLGSGADGNYGALFEADQTAASRTDGWTVAKIAAANSAEFDTGTKQASGAFSTQSGTPKPGSFLTGTTANAFKTPQPLTGTFAASAWTFAFAVRAVTASSQAGRMRLRVFRSVNASGAGATELTGATQVGSTTAALSTTVDQVSTVTWSPGTTFTLNNEFLFFVIAWEITTASGSNSGDVVLRTGQAAAGTFITTPALTLPKIETLIDTFDTVVDKTVKWPDSNAATVWDASTQAKLPCATTYSSLATKQLAPSYNLTGSGIYAKMTPPATGTGTRELWLDVLTDTGNTNKLSMVVSGGNLIARRTLAGAQSGQNSATYDPVAHAWWRIRESGGTTYFDVSPDGNTWTNYYSVANGQPVTACWVSFSCGYFGTETADNGYVDYVNAPPPTAVSATDTNGATTESASAVQTGPGGATDVNGTTTESASVVKRVPMEPPGAPVLDTFNRPDEQPLSTTNWGTLSGAAQSYARVISNQLSGDVGGNVVNGVYWKTDFAQPHEAFITVATLPTAGDFCGVAVAVSNETATGWNGYEWRLTSAGTILLIRVAGGTGVTEDTKSYAVQPGDKLMVRTLDATVYGYVVPASTGTPVLLTTWADPSPLTGTKLMALVPGETVGRYDNFGGGTYVFQSGDANGATTESASVTSIKLSDTDVGGLPVPGTAQLVALIGAPDASNLAADAATLVAKPATTIDVNGATTETQTITVPVAATDANGATTEATSFAPIAVAATDVNGTTTDAPTVKAVVAATDANATTTETGSAVAAVTPVSSSDANGTTTEAASIQIAASDANGATTESAGIAVYSSDAGGSAALPAITTSGLAIRFDASQLALADGASVSPWPNIANAAVPGTISGSPAPVVRANALNGLPVVRFNLGQGAVVIASGSGVDKDFTIAYVAHMVSATVNNGRVLQALIPNNVLFGFWKGGLPSGVQDTAYVDPNFLVPDNRPAVTTAWKLYSADGASASYLPRMFSNGVLVSTAPSTPTGGFAGTLALNHPYTGSPDEGSDCEVAEVIVYNRQLSDVERQTVESYLRQKWLGVAVVSETATVAQPSTFTGTDTNGATTEAATVVVKATATDANGATTDAQTLVAKPADTDNNGATTEATTIVAKPSSTDANAATTEAVALAAQLSSADANGATTDATTQTAAIPATDTNGAVTEAASQRQTTADANGVVTEATTSVAQLAASDANSATTETQAQQQTATDTNGAVTEATALVFAVTVTDANGPTTEIQSTGVPIPAADANGATTEAATLVAQLATSDINAAVTESAAQRQTTADANGTVTETAALALPASDTNAATTEAQTLRLSAVTDQNAATTEAVALVAKLSATDQDVGAAEATTTAASAAVSGGPQAGGSVVESYLRAGADFVSGGPGASGSKTESWSITVAVSGGPAAAGSKAEASVRTDARAGGPIAGGSLTQTRTNSDTVSGGPAAAGTRVESRSATDARAGGPIAAGSVVESHALARTDVVTGGPIAGGTRVESRSATDARSGGPAAAGSVVEVYQRAGADVVSGGPVVGGSRVESWAHSDFVTGGPGVSGSLTESHGHANFDTVAGGPGVTGHVTETHIYNDAATGGPGVSGSVVESYSHVSPPLAFGALVVTGSVVEQLVYTAAPVGPTFVTGSSTAPIVIYNDAPRGGPIVRGSVVETWGRPAVFPKVEQPTSVLPLTLSLRTVALTDGSLRTVTVLNGQRSTLESPLRTTKVELSMTSVILPKGAQGPLYIDKPEGELMVTGST